MKKLVLACLLLLLSGAFLAAFGQRDVFWRTEATLGMWEHGTAHPWWYILSPDASRWRPDYNIGGVTRHNVIINNNVSPTMNVNSNTWFGLRSLTFTTGSNVNRTLNRDGNAGIGLTHSLVNNSDFLKTFNVPIGVDEATVTFNAGTTSGDRLVFNNSIFINANIAAFTGTGNTTVNGVMSGTGSVTKSGTGTLTLTGANTYTGTTTINGGTLVLNPTTGSALPATNSVEVNSGGTLRITGGTQTLAHLTVNAGGTVIIESTGRLEITGTMTSTGTITNNANIAEGGLVIHSGASLIHNNAGVNATMHRNFPNSHHWRLISSPVVGQAITGDWSRIIEADNRGYDFFDWHEANSIWRNQKVSGNLITQFVAGRGYLVSYWIRGGTVEAPTFSAIANLTQTFAGELNNGNVPVTITHQNTGAHRGANLIGNPYPSAIDWNLVPNRIDFFADHHAYIYDPAFGGGVGGYISVDGSFSNAFIAPNQGFFVLVRETPPTTFTFTPAMRAHGGSFKAAPVQENLVIRLWHGNFYDETTMRIRESSQWTRDPYDAAKFFSFNNQAPQLFSQSSDQVQLAVNSVPQVDQSSEFTLGLRAPATGQYTLSLQTSNGAFDQRDVFVRDLLTGAVHNLRQNPQFAFHATQGDHAARFKVSFTQPTTVGNLPQGTTAIYVHNNILHLNFASDESNRLLQVFDISGRVVKSQRLQDGASQSIPLALEMGTYIVRITDSQGVATQRVMVK